MSVAFLASPCQNRTVRGWSVLLFLVLGCQSESAITPRPATTVAPATLPPDAALPKPTAVIDPSVLRDLASNDSIPRPTGAMMDAMVQTGATKFDGKYEICIDDSGNLLMVNVLREIGHSPYDELIVESLRGWRFKPYLVGEEATAGCGTIAIQFQVQ